MTKHMKKRIALLLIIFIAVLSSCDDPYPNGLKNAPSTNTDYSDKTDAEKITIVEGFRNTVLSSYDFNGYLDELKAKDYFDEHANKRDGDVELRGSHDGNGYASLYILLWGYEHSGYTFWGNISLDSNGDGNMTVVIREPDGNISKFECSFNGEKLTHASLNEIELEIEDPLT